MSVFCPFGLALSGSTCCLAGKNCFSCACCLLQAAVVVVVVVVVVVFLLARAPPGYKYHAQESSRYPCFPSRRGASLWDNYGGGSTRLLDARRIPGPSSEQRGLYRARR